jgi:hypothetical protein
MAQKKTAAEATTAIANYNTQLTELNANLAGVQGGLLDMANVGQDSYLASTGETALTKQDLPNFADIYNPLYKKMKDIKFTLGEDATTANADQAFYVFNAETEAKRQTDEQISVVEKQNEAFDTQQQNIAEFVKQKGESQKLAIQDQYIQSVINKSSTLSKGFITSADTGFDMNAYKAAKGKNKTISYDANRKPIYSYKLSEEEAAQRLQIVKDTAAFRFKLDSTLQQSETAKYAATLVEQQKTLNKAITKGNEYLKRVTKKEAEAAAKAAKKANKKK